MCAPACHPQCKGSAETWLRSLPKPAREDLLSRLFIEKESLLSPINGSGRQSLFPHEAAKFEQSPLQVPAAIFRDCAGPSAMPLGMANLFLVKCPPLHPRSVGWRNVTPSQLPCFSLTLHRGERKKEREALARFGFPGTSCPVLWGNEDYPGQDAFVFVNGMPGDPGFGLQLVDAGTQNQLTLDRLSLSPRRLFSLATEGIFVTHTPTLTKVSIACEGSSAVTPSFLHATSNLNAWKCGGGGFWLALFG